MKTKNLILLFVATIAISFTSCSGDKKNDSTDTATAPTNEATEDANTAVVEDDTSSPNEDAGDNLLASPERLQKAEDQLRNLPKFKGKEVMVFQDIHFYGDGRIKLAIQDPEKPENIDEYNYESGGWGDPIPVQITGNGDMAANTFNLSKTPFTKMNGLYQAWMAEAEKIDDKVKNEPTNGYVSKWVPTQTIKWYFDDIETARAQYSLEINQNGEVTGIRKQ